jgi:hypothetical protein
MRTVESNHHRGPELDLGAARNDHAERFAFFGVDEFRHHVGIGNDAQAVVDDKAGAVKRGRRAARFEEGPDADHRRFHRCDGARQFGGVQRRGGAAGGEQAERTMETAFKDEHHI